MVFVMTLLGDDFKAYLDSLFKGGDNLKLVS